MPRPVLLWLALAALLAACIPNTPPPATTPVLKLLIAEPGIYRLTRAELQAAGFPVAADLLDRYQLRHRFDLLPLERDGPDSQFTLYFYALPQTSIYSATDAYWLTLAAAPVPPLQTRTVEAPRAAPAESFVETVVLAENRLYSASDFDGLRWFWLSLTSPLSSTVTARLPGVLSGTARVRLTLAGATEGEHHVRIAVNGVDAGETRWAGRTTHRAEFASEALRAGDNAITLQALGLPDQPEVDFLDEIALAYPRAFAAADNALTFAGGKWSVRVRELRDPQPRLYDVTDPRAPLRLTGGVIAPEGGAYALSFQDALGERRYVALAPSAARAPVVVRPAPPIAADGVPPGADYLVIAPAQFAEALAPLLAHRREQGLSARLVTSEQVFDMYGDGVSSPLAIRDFVRAARAQWKPAPRFVLLVGKASYDYRDYLQAPNKNLLPTFLAPSLYLGEAASDNWFVAGGDADPLPALAIGRIPAKSVEQVRIAVGKITAYERAADKADWLRRALLIADDKEPLFVESAEMVAGLLPASVAPQRLYLKDAGGNLAALREQIVRGWNAGAGLVSYIGHGSIDTWAAGPLFGVDNAPEIKNGSRLPILLTPTCLDGFFYHPQKDSLAEVLLFKPDGGIIGGLVPTGLSLPFAQDQLTRALLEELFVNGAPTLGEAVMRAKRLSPPNDDNYREVLETFVWLGDPALLNPFAQR